MAYENELQMYPDITQWLERFLKERYKDNSVTVLDTSRIPLKRVFQNEHLHPSNKPEWPTYDIRVDVTGLIVRDDQIELVFIECKNTPITLRDISQLLGYSRVANPIFSCILSPAGMSSDVMSLLKTYGRYDILQYDWSKGNSPRSIRVAEWNQRRQDIDYSKLIPPGEFF